MVEVVFHGAFAATGDDDDVFDAGGNSLFDAVLNDGLVDEGQHLLGDDLGGGQETWCQVRRRERLLFELALLISSPFNK